MNNVWALTKIQLMSYMGINKVIHSHDKKVKRNFILLSVLIGFSFMSLFVMAAAYFYSLGIAYLTLGMPQMIVGAAMAYASVICLITTVYKGSAVLFGASDFDIIMPMPIKSGHIVLSKIATLYSMNLVFMLFLMIPGIGVYAYLINPPITFYLYMIPMTILIPVVPILIGTIISLLISTLASRFKYKNMVTIIFTLAAVVVMMAVSFGSANVTEEMLSDLATTVTNTIYGIYPLTKVFVSGVCDGNILAVILYCAISVMVLALFTIIVGRCFKSVHTALVTVKSESNYKMTEQRSQSVTAALYKKELKRYFSCPAYVVNTIVGAVLLTLGSGMLAFMGEDALSIIFETPELAAIMGTAIPLLIATMISMTCTTMVSISLEGKNLSIIKSMPIKPMEIFRAKILMNLTITVPAVLINVPIIAYVMKLDMVSTILSFLIPLAYCILSALFGIVVNLMFPMLEWTTEVMVVKQSAASVIGIMGGMLMGLAPGIALILLPPSLMLIGQFFVLALVVAISVILFAVLNKWGTKKFLTL